MLMSFQYSVIKSKVVQRYIRQSISLKIYFYIDSQIDTIINRKLEILAISFRFAGSIITLKKKGLQNILK